MSRTDSPRSMADRVFNLLLRAYPAEFRDRFATGMRYAFNHDREIAASAGIAARGRFWFVTIVDTVRAGLAERSESRSLGRRKGTRMRSWFTMDWRYGWRALRATPVVTAVSVLSLALGIGATTALFSIFNGLTLKPLPVPNAASLVLLDDGPWSNPIWEQIRAVQDELADGAFAWSAERFNLSQTGEADPVDGVFASGRIFDVLGVSAVRGRTFTASDDDRSGGPAGPVTVISHRFWQRRFAGADDAVGRTLVINGTAFTIVGVTPSGFFGPDVGRAADVMLPLGTEAMVRGADSMLDGRTLWWINIMLRLRPGQSAEQMTGLLRGRQDHIRVATMPAAQGNTQATYIREPFELVPAAAGRSSLRARYQKPLKALVAVVGLVLLIACANIANLQLARVTARRRELGVRLALGASRARLSRQLLSESLMVAGAGAALGLLVARWGSDALVAQLSSAGNQVYLNTSLDWRVLTFTLGLAATTAILFGVAPAFSTGGVSPHEAVKQQGRGPSGERHTRFRQALIVLQVALSVVLVVTASLFARTFLSLAGRDVGFDRAPVLLASVTVRQPMAQRMPIFERLREAAAAVPGVSDAAISFTTPIGRAGWNTVIVVPGSPLDRRQRLSWINVVSPGWFKTYGIALAGGRDFEDRDRQGAPPVAIVNRAFARKYLKGGTPIGQRFTEEGPSETGNTLEVVGLVDDTVYRSLRSDMEPIIFRPTGQWDDPGATVMLGMRSAGAPPLSLTRSVSEALGRADSRVSMTFSTLASQVDASLNQERLLAAVSTFFGMLALLLASLGLYGVTSYSVNRRRAEIGIRMALGAEPGKVVRMVLTRVGTLVILGIAIGIGTSLWAARFVTSLLYGLTPSDPATFAAAAVVLSLVALLAGWLPARRATRIDPLSVLRDA